MTIPIPTSSHNEALTGDFLYSAFLNYEWRQIVVPYIVRGMEEIAREIADESERQAFEVLYGAMIEDFYNEDIVDGTPVGMINAYPSLTPPSKWLLCNGQSLLKTDYPALFALIGTKYGGTSTHFSLPNLSDRFIYGQRIVGGNPTIDNVGGEARVTLDITEIPSHSHVQQTRGGAAGAVATTAGYLASVATPVTTSTTSTQPSGGGASHNNLPPYHSMAWMIKALP